VNRLPVVTGSELIGALQRAGFTIIRQRGSHVFIKHPDGPTMVVPVHRGEALGRGLLMKIARDLELTRAQLVDLLRKLSRAAYWTAVADASAGSCLTWLLSGPLARPAIGRTHATGVT
jgi:predicted RNA binding protein YcfA (HicA-like mRNA interferase family)